MKAGVVERRFHELVLNFKRTGDEIVEQFTTPLQRQETPDTLYHYTNESGLRGILASGTLWFTDIFQLNDPSELNHGLEHARRLVDLVSKMSLKPEVKLSAEVFATNFVRAVHSSANYFVCCLSQSGDDLTQWRSYANNGRGFALAFDRRLLEEAFMRDAKGAVAAYAVSYSDNRLCELHEKLIENWKPYISSPMEFDGLSGKQIANYQRDLAVQLAIQILQVSVRFKHEAYLSEREYRFFQMFAASREVPDLMVRARDNLKVRYRAFKWTTDALKKIIIGPAADKAIATNIIDESLKSFAPPAAVSIETSTIPYRI